MHTALLTLAAFLAAFAFLLLAGVVYQAAGTRHDRRHFPPPGRLIRWGERSMHICTTGGGTPAVVFESGMGASSLSWAEIQPDVAQFTRAVSYDRAGHGWSDPSREPRTAQHVARELHELLDRAGVPGPYVLVGHSFGGYVNMAFAHLYPGELAGMVLVDAIHHAEWESPTPEQRKMIEDGLRYARIAAWLTRLGFVRLCLALALRGSSGLARAGANAFGPGAALAVERIAGEVRKLPPRSLPIVRALWSQPKNFLTLGRYLAALPVSARQAARLTSLGDLPLVVLSADHRVSPYTDWQRDMAQLSSRGRQLAGTDCGHWLHLDRPELVVRTIREVVAAARIASSEEAQGHGETAER